MDLSKLRRGELIAAVGGIVLLVAMFGLDWYAGGADISTPFGDVSVEGGSFGPWDGQGFTGTIADLVILAAAIAAIGLAVVTATSRTVALPVAASALTAGLGIAAVAMVLLRMLFQPGPNELIELRFGIWLALISSAVIAYGGWEAMKEEGTSFEDARDQLRDRAQSGQPAGPSAPTSRPTDRPIERPAEPGASAAPGAAAQPAEPVTHPPPESEGSHPPPRPAP
jgi:hypothetical protein